MTRQLLEQGHPLQVSGRAAAQVEIVVPVKTRNVTSARACAGWTLSFPPGSPSPPVSRSPTTRSTDGTWADRPRAGRRARRACAPCAWTGKGRGRALRDGLVGQRRRRRRLHGRRPVDRPRRAAAAGRAAAVRAQRRRDRHPAGARRPGGPRPAAGGHLPRLQPAAARRARARGSPTRSAASRRCGPTRPGRCCRWSRTRLVLRHRAAGARRARRAAHPRGAGRLGRRPRPPGRHRAPPPSPTCAASPGSAPAWPRRAHRCRGCSAAGRSPRPGSRRRCAASCSVRRGRRASARSPTCCCSCCCAARCRRSWRNALSLLVTAVANTAANRRLHVRRRAAAAARVRHQLQRPGRVRRRPRRSPAARWPRCTRAVAAAGRRAGARRARRWPTWPPPLLRFVAAPRAGSSAAAAGTADRPADERRLSRPTAARPVRAAADAACAGRTARPGGPPAWARPAAARPARC